FGHDPVRIRPTGSVVSPEQLRIVGEFSPDFDYARPSKAQNTQACPCRFRRDAPIVHISMQTGRKSSRNTAEITSLLVFSGRFCRVLRHPLRTRGGLPARKMSAVSCWK